MEAALKLVEPIEELPVDKKALSFFEIVKALPPIKTSDEYIKVGEIWKNGRELLKEIDEGYDDLIHAAHKLHKDAVAKKAKYYNPAESAVKLAKSLMITYDAEQERIRKAEEDRLRKIAEDEERDRRRVEQERLEAERKAEEDRLLAEAQAAKDRGDNDTAEILTNAAVETSEAIKEQAVAIAQEPIYVAPVVVQKTTPKMAGGPVYREVWAAEVTDIKALCLAVATGKVSPESVTANMPVLNKLAVALKGTMNIPGVKAYSKRV